MGDQAEDIVTAFLIFVRDDYGRTSPGSVVVDVGANLGLFSLHAAHAGARRVYAYEPSTESLGLIQRNIEANRLGNTITVFPLAVTGKAGGTVRFSRRADVQNSIDRAKNELSDDTVEVGTTDLATIVAQAGPIDLLKLDCEGAEYDILWQTPSEVFGKIRTIKMEYHRGRADEIIGHLGRIGYRCTLQKTTYDDQQGNLWFER